jgi:hypothetical protein
MAKTVIEGATELLVETVDALSSVGENEYIIIGGWCPYLRNTSSITHPGTLDVDVLFKKGHIPGSLKAPIEALRRNGFVLSAKHSFQLLKEKQIGKERLIYNVDILHPLMSENHKGLYVDHLDLDIPLDDEERRVKRLQSIVQPNSAVLFDERLFSSFELRGVSINLVDFTGMFITKMDSCQKLKRDRDSFDIHLGFKSSLVDLEKLHSILLANERVAKSLTKFSEYLIEEPDQFNERVSSFMNLQEDSAQFIRESLRPIL